MYMYVYTQTGNLPYNSTMTKELAEQLRCAIRKSGMSIYQLSKESGVTHPTILRFMSGQTDMRLSRAEKIAKVLGFSLKPD